MNEFNRISPYAHRDYDAEFTQAGADDILNDLGPMPKDEYDYYKNL